MRDSGTPAVNTTHDWAASVDHEHLAQVRQQLARYAPTGVGHLILDVLAYAADEAEAIGRARRGIVTLHEDGSVSVADDGRGISVVAALSEWLIHTNRRTGGSWTQRYEHGVPTTDLTRASYSLTNDQAEPAAPTNARLWR